MQSVIRKKPSKRRRLWLAVLACIVLAAAVAAVLEPNRVVCGWLAGEPFFRWRPASYWKEVLRAERDPGPPYRHSAAEFYAKEKAVGVLRECAHDPDPNVRRRAVFALAEGPVRLDAIRDALAGALVDPDAEVRFMAVAGLVSYGPGARPAFSALTALLHDPEGQVAFAADVALWEIDPAAARDATGWRRFAPDGWGFSIEMPGEPKESTISSGGPAAAVSRQFMATQAGLSQFGVAVTDYPKELPFPADDAARLDLARDSVLAGVAAQGLRAKVSSEAPVEAGGVKGREFQVDVEGMGFIRSRAFWAGRRLYQVKVASQPRFLNAKAADYFLDSFRVKAAEARPR